MPSLDYFDYFAIRDEGKVHLLHGLFGSNKVEGPKKKAKAKNKNWVSCVQILLLILHVVLQTIVQDALDYM